MAMEKQKTFYLQFKKEEKSTFLRVEITNFVNPFRVISTLSFRTLKYDFFRNFQPKFGCFRIKI